MRGPVASAALLAVGSPVALAALVGLAADRLTPGQPVIAALRQALASDSVTESLLDAVAAARSVPAAWGASGADHKGLSLLVLLFPDLVQCASSSSNSRVRGAAARCLLLIGSELLGTQ